MMDREFAKVMMRHFDAIDLLTGAMIEIIRAHGPEDSKTQMEKNIYRCIGDLHLDVRAQIAKAFPEFDQDKK